MNKDEGVIVIHQSSLRGKKSGAPELQHSIVQDVLCDSPVPSSAPSAAPFVFSSYRTSPQTSVSSLSTSSCPKPVQRPEPVGRGLSEDVLAWGALKNNVEHAGAGVQRHPRRSSTAPTLRQPPKLQRQEERKTAFVDGLVGKEPWSLTSSYPTKSWSSWIDSATDMVEAIWPLSTSPRCKAGPTGKGVLPLRMFIQETLKRSGTSYSTLQVALYYLILIKPHVPSHDFTMQQPQDEQSLRALQCGRRMFLAALILASKYLQDRTYSANAWSKISGLKVAEVNLNEMTFLSTVKWKLHIPTPTFERWTDIVLTTSSPQPPGPPTGLARSECWKSIVRRLTPDLESIPSKVSSAVTMACHTSQVYRLLRPIGNSGLEAWPIRFTSPEGATSDLQGSQTFHARTEVDLPPLPPTRVEPLPTPQITPESSTFSTPAVSATFAKPWCLHTTQSVCMTQTVIQHGPRTSTSDVLSSYPGVCRLSSTRSSSSESSPESMVSDNSSYKHSRSSSFSSVSSSLALPGADFAKLVRIATCTDVCNTEPETLSLSEKDVQIGLGDAAAPISNSIFGSLCASPKQMTNWSPTASDVPGIQPAQCERSICMGPPKRTHSQRESVDLSCLQDHVRDLLSSEKDKKYAIRRDPVGAESFLLRPTDCFKASVPPQLPLSSTSSRSLIPVSIKSVAVADQVSLSALPYRRPAATPLGKRRCCAHTAATYDEEDWRASYADA